jgi:hypothetical protein
VLTVGLTGRIGVCPQPQAGHKGIDGPAAVVGDGPGSERGTASHPTSDGVDRPDPWRRGVAAQDDERGAPRNGPGVGKKHDCL